MCIMVGSVSGPIFSRLDPSGLTLKRKLISLTGAYAETFQTSTFSLEYWDDCFQDVANWTKG